MPPNPAPSITGRLGEIGFSEASGMGVGPLSWQTIDAWQRLTGVPLSPWEARLLRLLSSEYVAESRRAESENCPPPWRAEPTQQDRDAEMAQIKASLGIPTN